jgi:site-specific recombinase XerD
MRLEDCHHKFCMHMRLERDCSKQTIISYRTDFRQFLSFLELKGIPSDIESITTSVVRDYIFYMAEERGLDRNSIRRKIHSLRSFFRYACREEYVEKDPTLRIAVPKKKKPIPIYLSAEDLQKLIEAPMSVGKERTKLRDTLILKTLAFTGIRRSELVGLNWGDIDFNSQTMKVHGKGDKERVIPLPPPLCAELDMYRQLKGASSTSPVFTSITGRRLTGRIITELFHRYEKKAGIDGKGYTVHKIRHSFATLLLQNNVSVVEIQKLMGHSDISSSLIYLHTTAQRLQDAVQKHPLLDKK